MYIYIYKYWNGPFTVKVKQIEKKEGKAKMQTTKQTNQVFFRDTETAFMICVWRLLQRSQIHLHHALRSAGVYLCSLHWRSTARTVQLVLSFSPFRKAVCPFCSHLEHDSETKLSRWLYLYIHRDSNMCIYAFIYIYARSNLDCVLMSRNLTRSMCRYNIWYVYIYSVIYFLMQASCFCRQKREHAILS